MSDSFTVVTPDLAGAVYAGLQHALVYLLRGAIALAFVALVLAIAASGVGWATRRPTTGARKGAAK